MNEFCPPDTFRFGDFLLEITGKTDGGRCRIGIIMGGHDLHDIFLPAGVPFRGRPRPGIGRGCGAHLNPGVHVGFVIKADVDEYLRYFLSPPKGTANRCQTFPHLLQKPRPEYHPSPES